MILTIDTSVPLTTVEKVILLSLMEKDTKATPTEAPVEPVKRTRGRPRKTAEAPPPAEEPETTEEPDEKPLITVEDAARLAADVFMMPGGRAFGKEFLASLELEKVRELSPEQAVDFVAALTEWKNKKEAEGS